MSACLRRSLAEWLHSACRSNCWTTCCQGCDALRSPPTHTTNLRWKSVVVRTEDTSKKDVIHESNKLQHLQQAFARSGLNAAVSWNLAAACSHHRQNKTIRAKTAERKLSQLQEYLPVNTLQEILRKNAFILGFKMDGVGQRLKALCTALSIDHQHLQALLVKHPLLLFIDPATVPERVEKFSRIFGATQEHALNCIIRNPALLTFPDDYWETRAEQLCGILGISQAQMTSLVRKYMPLILSKPMTVSQKMESFQQILGLSKDDVAKIVAHQPPILGLNSQILQDRLHQLTKIFNVDHEQVVNLIAKQPVVCCYSETLLGHRWNLLHELAASHPNWQESFGALSLASKSRFLRCSERRLDRLRYLRDVRRQGELKVSVILNMTDERFHQKYPEYECRA